MIETIWRKDIQNSVEKTANNEKKYLYFTVGERVRFLFTSCVKQTNERSE